MKQTNKIIQHGSSESFINGDARAETNLSKSNESLAYKSYKYRWVILTLYSLCCVSSTIHWPEYAIIANVVVEYYGVSYTAVTWTGMVFLFWYSIFLYPATYLIQKWGLRTAVVIGSFGGCAGAWIKLASIDCNRFWVIIVGQSVIAITQSLLTSIPALVAATWFGPEQVSTACSIGLLGFQIGIAICSFVAPMVVANSSDAGIIKEGLYRLNLGYAAVSSAIFIVTIIGFRGKPPTPPSRAQLSTKQSSLAIGQSVKRLVKNGPFMMFLLAYSCSMGIFFGICFLFNIILIAYYKNAELDVGRIGTVFVIAGTIGSVICGTILDRFRKFKQTTLVLFGASTISILIFSLCLNQGIHAQYGIVAIVGFFNNAVLPCGLEIGAEITYPEPISISSGMLLISSKICGILIIHLYTFLFSNLDGVTPHLLITAMALLSTIIIIFTPFPLKRQAAEVALPVK